MVFRSCEELLLEEDALRRELEECRSELEEQGADGRSVGEVALPGLPGAL